MRLQDLLQASLTLDLSYSDSEASNQETGTDLILALSTNALALDDLDGKPLAADIEYLSEAFLLSISNIQGVLLAGCRRLVAVDKQAPKVELISFTLQQSIGVHPKLLGTAYEPMAETWSGCPNSQQGRTLWANSSAGLPGTSFLEYTSQYWELHEARDPSDSAQLVVLNEGQTPLSGAASDEEAGVVNVILKPDDVNPGRPDGCRQTALFSTAWVEHRGVVGIMLGSISPESPDKHSQTRLWSGAENGQQGVAKSPLEWDSINTSELSNYYSTKGRQPP
ncbi:hypothetical protein HOY80DRAFT_1136616 [Tuber brumale]|nr:hypothetical protein HOY80DRAFT_1136616 [Tuber brumale]